MRIAVAATPSVAIPSLDWLETSNHKLALVITQPDRPAGRGRSMRDSPVSKWANSHAIRCIKPVDALDMVKDLSAIDLVVTIGYGVILPTEILAIPKYGFVNLHFSKLPKWRGAAPVQRAILNGDQEIGLTVFGLDKGMDTGPIYIQGSLTIDPYENAGDVLQRMASLGPNLISESIASIESGEAPRLQSGVGVSYAPKVSKEEARISWIHNASQIDRLIRAFTPEPGAWTLWRGDSLQIRRARPFQSQTGLNVGEFKVEAGNVIVGCGSNESILIEEVIPAGKNRMSAKSWMNGARVLPGESFV